MPRRSKRAKAKKVTQPKLPIKGWDETLAETNPAPQPEEPESLTEMVSSGQFTLYDFMAVSGLVVEGE
jgi:hypothetical protein